MKHKWKFLFAVLTVLALFYFFIKPRHFREEVQTKEVLPEIGSIEKSVSATAVVQPRSRLEMKPSVAGRIDQILVKEGQEVKTGDTLILMSSTERAALLDAAKSNNQKEMSYWENIYKPISIIAPIDGTVIVSTMQPGQTVTQTDAIIVLSDQLIVQAQVDETDIGKIKEGQSALVTLDAYPGIEVQATVSHIYYESKTVNNVTIYQVDILPEKIPDVFRSGMSANVHIIQEKKEGVLRIPQEAVKRGQKEEGSFVLVSQGNGQKPEHRPVTLGISDGVNVEVISGINEKETLIIPTQKYSPMKNIKSETNPLMPQGQRRNSRPASSR